MRYIVEIRVERLVSSDGLHGNVMRDIIEIRGGETG